MHVFEQAGLGKAPFRLIAVSEKRGPIILPDGGQVGAPGQPMGTCDYCGNGIAICCEIQSADGKRFIVGSDCVRKTDDRGLSRSKPLRDYQRKIRHEREKNQLEKLEALINRKTIRDCLSGVDFSDSWRSRSALEWADWMMRNAGTSGKLKVLRAIKKHCPEQVAA